MLQLNRCTPMTPYSHLAELSSAQTPNNTSYRNGNTAQTSCHRTIFLNNRGTAGQSPRKGAVFQLTTANAHLPYGSVHPSLASFLMIIWVFRQFFTIMRSGSSSAGRRIRGIIRRREGRTVADDDGRGGGTRADETARWMGRRSAVGTKT